MLKILDRNKVPVKGLKKYDDLCIESVLELDDRTLSFSAPYRNIRNAVVNEGYIETRTDRYVVKEIEKNTEGTAKVVAQLDLESLEGKVFREFRSEEQTIKSALQLAFAGTGWAIGVCEVNKKRTLSMSNVSALEVLKQALKTYRAEIKVNSKFQIISIYNAIGSDKGSYFANQLNLKSLTVQSTSYDFYTEIEPYGKDGLTIEAVNSGKTYLENHQYSSKVKRCIWKDERYTVPESLKEDAEAKLADMSKPYVSYSADVIDLAKCSEKYRILEYGIGDIITLIDDITDTREKQRIVGMKIYPDAPEKNSCTLANKVLTFDEFAQKYEDTVNTVDNITNDNGQIDGDAIDGIYSRQIVDLENAIVSSVHIKDLDAKYVQVSGKLTAVEGEFGSIKGNIADFEDAYAKRLSAAEADIVQLRTTDLSAVNGRIDVLDSNYANIRNLLSGAAGIGDLQNIHLTSDNAVIDTALIREAVMQSVSIADLLAGTISTNKFLIASDDGGIRIQGATQQWSDTDGTVRMQAGRDANGDFTFSLFDKTGKGILIDATGVKPDAIADGLIVNKMVADNAGIAGSKLDISSVVSAINDSSQSIKSSRIWFDEEKQTLNQLYAQINKNITTIQLAAESASNTANTASNTANTASDTAKKALETLSGISTLDAIGASLDNDAHVVHTNADGSGGDYRECHTTFFMYLGDADVSDHIAEIKAEASEGVTGTFDKKTRTYQVTAMEPDSGYVDISALHGESSWLKKRFSISKSKDGKIGLSYDLRVSSPVLRKQADETLLPESVTFSTFQNDNGLIRSYAGVFQIEESLDDGKTYALKYGSTSAETMKIYKPSGTEVKIIRCTVYDASGVQNLDQQSVIILADAEGLADEIKKTQEKADKARDAIVTTNRKVSKIETGVEGLRTELSETTTDLHGLTDGTLLYNCYYHDNGDGTTTVTAVVYRAGQDVTAEFPEKSFSWIRKTEAGEQDLGYGYSITVKNSDYMFGGVVVGQFTTDVDENQRKALLSVQEGVVEIDGKPVSLSAEQKDYVDANTLSEVVTIPTGKKFIFTDAATNQGGTVALENLARQILLNLTTQTFELDQGTKTLPDALNELNRDLQYIPIEILAFSNNIGVAEKGSTLNELTLKWQLNKEPETILMNGRVRADLKTLRSLTLKGMALTADKTFMLQVTDEKGKTAQKNTSVVFQNGVYYGVSEIPEEVNNTFILSLSRSLQGSRTKTFSTTSTEDQYIWYAFPSRYGTPVFSVGGFDGGFTKAASISFTNASGYTEEYAVYRSDNSNLDTKTIKVT